jgi:hypothetical protein
VNNKNKKRKKQLCSAESQGKKERERDELTHKNKNIENKTEIRHRLFALINVGVFLCIMTMLPHVYKLIV